MAAQVKVGGQVVDKPGTLLDEMIELELVARPPYVSRGGEKLAHALDRFGIYVEGLTAADIGASTGGFTDCLLQRGAALVYAIDVGHGQIDYGLRRDERVVVMEGVNARYLESLPQPVDIATIDVSFISLQKVLPAVRSVLRPGGRIIALFKPQFEANRREVGKGGVIRDSQLHAKLLGRFADWATAHGFRIVNLTLSPLLGPAGNREFVIYLRPDSNAHDE